MIDHTTGAEMKSLPIAVLWHQANHEPAATPTPLEAAVELIYLQARAHVQRGAESGKQSASLSIAWFVNKMSYCA